MSLDGPAFIPYPAIEAHGAIGNRRTAALVAADGTLDWLCLPTYAGTVACGTLIEAGRAGYFRLGPDQLLLGRQRYVDDAPVLVTSWCTPDWQAELTDFLAFPADDQAPGSGDFRLVRRLRCTSGRLVGHLDVCLRYEFDMPAAIAQGDAHRLDFDLDQFTATLWSSLDVRLAGDRAIGEVALAAGEECLAVLAVGEADQPFTAAWAAATEEHTLAYWRSWQSALRCPAGHEVPIRRSATTIHLMGFSPAGSSVAAPTTSLPERIGGSRNYDYRFAWVRDASLSTGTLSLLGDTSTGERYMDWLAGLESSTDAPLQVAYGVNGEQHLQEQTRTDLNGYRGSLPVRTGNHAYHQRQLGGLGYVADCAKLFLENGGQWKPEFWDLTRRLADYIQDHWREQDHGIWELPTRTHHVSSKVMCWVTLDRGITIARRVRPDFDVSAWEAAREAIHEEVMRRGWSERLQAFRQSFGADTLDASALLIPMMGFLPPDHPRVRATVERLEQQLMLNGYLYRMDPRRTEGVEPLPMGELEGAFLPVNFLLVSVYAQMGEAAKAEALLSRLEALAGDLGLFPEEVDARNGTFLGNSPLLFTHAEHIRAVLALNNVA